MKRRTNTNPMRAVVKAMEHEGVVAFNYTHGQGLRSRWWELELECGHVTERSARYPKGASGGRRGHARHHHPPPSNLMLPAPTKVRCAACGRAVHEAEEA